MTTAGFCVVDSNYQSQLKKTVKSLLTKSKIDFFFIYKQKTTSIPADPFLRSKCEFRDLPDVPVKFTSHTEYDKIMPLLMGKLKIFSDLSKEYDQVFNIDLDMMVLRDINPILSRYNGEYLYGCVEDTNISRLYPKRIKVLNFLGISPYEYINAGFMILNFVYDFNADEVQKFFSLCPFSNCPEQDFINWKFKDRIMIMPNEVSWNKFLPFEADPYIVHFLGYPKPWHTATSAFPASYFFEKYKTEIPS